MLTLPPYLPSEKIGMAILNVRKNQFQNKDYFIMIKESFIKVIHKPKCSWTLQQSLK